MAYLELIVTTFLWNLKNNHFPKVNFHKVLGIWTAQFKPTQSESNTIATTFGSTVNTCGRVVCVTVPRGRVTHVQKPSQPLNSQGDLGHNVSASPTPQNCCGNKILIRRENLGYLENAAPPPMNIGVVPSLSQIHPQACGAEPLRTLMVYGPGRLLCITTLSLAQHGNLCPATPPASRIAPFRSNSKCKGVWMDETRWQPWHSSTNRALGSCHVTPHKCPPLIWSRTQCKNWGREWKKEDPC